MLQAFYDGAGNKVKNLKCKMIDFLGYAILNFERQFSVDLYYAKKPGASMNSL